MTKKPKYDSFLKDPRNNLVSIGQVLNLIKTKKFDSWYKNQFNQWKEGEDIDGNMIVDELSKMLSKTKYHL